MHAIKLAKLTSLLIVGDKTIMGLEVLKYFCNLKTSGVADDILVRLRSQKDVDIRCIVSADKVDITKINIEAYLYSNASLNLQRITRKRGKILALSNCGDTYEIEITSKEGEM